MGCEFIKETKYIIFERKLSIGNFNPWTSENKPSGFKSMYELYRSPYIGRQLPLPHK